MNDTRLKVGYVRNCITVFHKIPEPRFLAPRVVSAPVAGSSKWRRISPIGSLFYPVLHTLLPTALPLCKTLTTDFQVCKVAVAGLDAK
jgi:hypothetical protein